MGVRVLLLDYGGTILDPASEQEAHTASLESLIQEYKIPLTAEEVQRRTEARLYAEAPRQVERWVPLRTLIPRCLAEVLAPLGVRVPDGAWEAFWRRYVALHAERARPFPDAAPALDEAAERGFRLGLVSDADRDYLDATLGRLGLADRFEFVVTSEEVGAGKPNPRVFQAALRAAGAPPERTASLGDSLERDVLGAERLGILGVLVDRAGRGGHPRCARNLREAVRLVPRGAVSENDSRARAL